MNAKHRSLLPLQLGACLLAAALLLTGCNAYQDAPPGVVKDVLTDGNGDPLAQCEVSLMAVQGSGKDETANSVDHTTSDSSGAFAFEDVQPGRYRLGVVTKSADPRKQIILKKAWGSFRSWVHKESGSVVFFSSVFTVRDGKGIDLGELCLK